MLMLVLMHLAFAKHPTRRSWSNYYAHNTQKCAHNNLEISTRYYYLMILEVGSQQGWHLQPIKCYLIQHKHSIIMCLLSLHHPDTY
jgi:hypothetical protein